MADNEDLGNLMPDDPVELMEKCKANLPVWEFISFLLYAGTFALSDKEAMRASYVSELDFAWGYTSILAHACHKTNYAKYGVLMNLVLHSSHPWVRAILDHSRTYRSSDLPCTGIGLEAAIEHSVRALWLKTHGGDQGSEAQVKQRLEQIESTLQRSSRHRHLFEKRAQAMALAEDEAAADAAKRQERAEELEAAAAEEDWFVEEILGKRDNAGVMEYKIKWLNFNWRHNSWEPAANLAGSEMLIAKFEEKFKTCSNPRVSIHQFTQTV